MLVVCMFPGAAFGWGATGHAVIAYLAELYVQPAARAEVECLLELDASGLADPDDIGDEANWAGRYRDSQGRGPRYQQTHR